MDWRVFMNSQAGRKQPLKKFKIELQVLESRGFWNREENIDGLLSVWANNNILEDNIKITIEYIHKMRYQKEMKKRWKDMQLDSEDSPF